MLSFNDFNNFAKTKTFSKGRGGGPPGQRGRLLFRQFKFES